MNIEEVIKFMKENPFVKVTMPTHYRSWEYNYYDDKKDKLLTELGEVWDVELSKSYGEYTGYAMYHNPKHFT